MISDTLEFVQIYLSLLDQALNKVDGHLTTRQKAWLGFCLTSIIFTNSISWKAWERFSNRTYTDSALAKMFRVGNIPWNLLLQASVKAILKRYGIKKGVLIIDDSDHERSKNTTKIGYIHRIKDKKNDGYFNGQNLVFLILVTDVITLPVGFSFYMPDTKYVEWQKKNRELKKQGFNKKSRPQKPERDKNYRSKQRIALDLIESFFLFHNEIRIKCILADALYGSSDFFAKASKIQKTQVISQLHCNQLVRNEKGLLIEMKQHFSNIKKTSRKILIRGQKEKTIIFCARKLWVEAHRSKRIVIAIKYSNEETFRYIIASDMTWVDKTIVQTYTLRWLIEVFFQDWKLYEGWSNLAKQQGDEGSSRSVILSLLLDHSLFLHDAQKSCIESKLPLCTIGSLIEKSRVKIIMNTFYSISDSKNFRKKLEEFKNSLNEMIPLSKSTKHMNCRGFKGIFRKAG